MKVYIVVERCDDLMDFNPINAVYYEWQDARNHLDELADYYGYELDDSAFEFFSEDDGYYAGIEEHEVIRG